MSWKFKVLNWISPKLASKWVYKEATKKLDFIKSVLVPKNQLEFREILKPLYDLLITLPDISKVDKKLHHSLYIKSGSVSSNELLNALMLFQIKDFRRFNRHDVSLIVSNQLDVYRLSDWLSNSDSINLLYDNLEVVLQNAITLDRKLQEATNDINRRHPDLEITQENFSYYTSPEFKNIILSIIETLDFFMELYYEGIR